MDIIKEFNTIELQLHEVAVRINVLNYINPTNIEFERKKFFASNDYNPQFLYTPLNFDPKKLFEQLRSIDIPKQKEFALLRQQKASLKKRIFLIRSIGTAKMSKFAIALFGKPTDSLLARARNQAKRISPKKRQKNLSHKEVVSLFKKAFVKYGLNWEIKEKDMVASAAVIAEENTLYLKKGAKFSRQFITQLIVHEIGTHILRAENGRRQPYRMFGVGLPGYLETEEGLALYNQEIHDCMNERLLQMYAGRVLASQYAISHSFRETYTYLRRYFTQNDAWKLTLRVKRGLCDTSLPGAFTKDIAYLKGYYQVKEYIRKGGSYNDLYIGKIGIQHIKLVKQLPGLKDPLILPLYRYFGYFVTVLEDVLISPLKIIKTALTR